MRDHKITPLQKAGMSLFTQVIGFIGKEVPSNMDINEPLEKATEKASNLGKNPDNGGPNFCLVLHLKGFKGNSGSDRSNNVNPRSFSQVYWLKTRKDLRTCYSFAILFTF